MKNNGKSLELNKIYQGSALSVLKTFPDESIDMCVTSPPYWGLRDYNTEGQIWGGDPDCKHDFTSSKRKLHSGTNSNKGLPHHLNANKVDWEVEDAICSKCGAWKGELGLEPNPDMFVSHLCDIFDEVKRVLRPHGSCWVNLGDTYSNSGQDCNLPQKCLVQIPSRFAIEMTNRDWILRNEIIWHKSSCMPSPATDRFTVDFEKFFFFTKNKKYYFKQQIEPVKEISLKRAEYGLNQTDNAQKAVNVQDMKKMGTRFVNPNGRNKRTVWNINPKGFKDAHFAVYPPKLIETPIDASCPEWVDKKTGKPRERVLEKQSLERHQLPEDNPNYRPERYEGKYEQGQRFAVYNDKGYDDGKSNDEFEPGIVLDPFLGSGTTAEVAMKMDKKWVGIELNPDYIEIAKSRLKPTEKEYETKQKAKEFWE